MYKLVLFLIHLGYCNGGSDGEQEVINNKIQQMELEIQKLKADISSFKKGTIYTRWGRKVCPGNGTELVYTGIAGGGHYQHPGTAVEYICLPHDPNLITNEKIQHIYGASSYLFGAEYEDNFFGPNLFEHDVPCAVCFTPQSSVTLMIPGKNSCKNGWKREYFGKLASGYSSHAAASQYVCVDNAPEVLSHGVNNDDGKLFFAVKTRCGSLPCPPYTNDALMTCVVCTK